jgi:outer membrane receptor protein involved in Fe transport
MKKRNRNRNKQLNRKFYVPLLGATLASALALPTISWSQTSEATLRGFATPNSEVTARNVATGALRHTTAGSDGGYVLVGLVPGTYRVDAGPGTEQTITLSVASDESLNLGAGGAEVTGTLEEIIVKATRLFETKTSEVAEVVELHEIETLPQYTRNFLEFADTVPGMQFQIDSNGNTSLRGGAQLDEAINVFIDGVGQKDYVAQGSGVTGQSGSGQNGDPGNPFPQLAIGEYKVVTSNYKAEYGDAASAVIIAQTKSGTNEFQGEAFADYTNQNMRAETPAEAAAAQGKTKAPSWEYGLAQGGPIIKDVLHFFVTWEHKSLAEQNVVYPGGNITTAQADALGLPTSVTSQFGPTTNPFKEDLAFGKLDFEPTANDRFELTGKLREETQISGAAGQTATSASQQYKNDDNRWNLLWQHSADRWVNELRVDYQNTVSTTSSTNDNPQNNYIYFPNAGTANPAAGNFEVISVGGPGSGTGFRYGQTGTEVKDDFTLPDLQWAGEHTVKFGARFQAIDLSAATSSSNLNDASYYWAVTAAGVSANPFEVQFPQLTSGFGSSGITTSDKQYGLYLQDDWAIDKHLLINAGVRWDYEKVPAYLNFVTPANVVAAINGPFCGPVANPVPGCTNPLNGSYASILALGGPNYPGIDINNYISTGNNRKAPTNNFAPRLGFSYDINEDGMYVPFAAYGRSFNRNLFSTESLETTKIALNSNPQAYFPNAYGLDAFGACATAADENPTNHCYAWSPAYGTPAGLAAFATNPNSHEVDMLNNNLKTPYSDQFSVGFRSKLGDWNTTVTLSDVKSYDTILGHWGGRYNNGQFFQNGNQWGGQGVPGVGSLILWDNGGNDEDLQLGVQLVKPYTRESGWSMTIAYTYSDAFQNNSSGDEAGYNAGYNQYLFDLPYPADYKMLPSVAVPKHRLVVTYSHDLPWNFVVAGKVTLATPQPIDGAYCCVAGYNQYGGSVVESSGQPSETLGYRDLDLQVTKNFDISHDISAYVRADVLNVFNYSNFDPTAYIWPQTGTPQFNTSGPIVGFPRTLKIYGGVKW